MDDKQSTNEQTPNQQTTNEPPNEQQPLPKTVTILVCGSRNYDDVETIVEVLNKCREKYGSISIIQGACSGADTIAIAYAGFYKIPCLSYPAMWDKHGRAAGPIRNRQMIEEGKPSLVLAFHPDINSSKGTKNMMIQAIKARIPVMLIKDQANSMKTMTEDMLT